MIQDGYKFRINLKKPYEGHLRKYVDKLSNRFAPAAYVDFVIRGRKSIFLVAIDSKGVRSYLTEAGIRELEYHPPKLTLRRSYAKS